MNILNIFNYIKYIEDQLLPTYKDSNLCEHYAWLLLEKLYNKTKTELIVHDNAPLTVEQKNILDSWIALLVHQKKPIQYILGSVPFNDLDILVEPPVLIPRPETEEWVAALIERLKELKNQQLFILDMATGSGCIGLALAYHLPQSHITAVDISPIALRLAQKNAVHNNISHITFVQSDLFATITCDQQFDSIVSNPPYIAYAEYQSLDASVTEWEDEQALFADDNGLACIKKIIDIAPLYIRYNAEMKLHNIPQLTIEIGHQQAELVKDYMIAAHYNNVYIQQDLSKKNRVVMGRIDYVANSRTAK